jgi:alpha-beta hydrolase superfamily lysophospholipase
MSRRGIASAAAVLAALLLADPAGAASRPVTLTAADGVTVAAEVYEAPAPSAAVVLVHVLGGSKADWRTAADRFQASGVTALAIDLRGHGGSTGSSAPAAAMAQDVKAAVAWLAARPDIRPGALAVVGASLGATAALLAAADLPAVKAAVLISPAADYRGVRLDAAGRKFARRPMLLIASQDDPYALRTLRDLMPPELALREQRVSTVTGHGTRLLERDPDMLGALVDWVRRTLLS